LGPPKLNAEGPALPKSVPANGNSRTVLAKEIVFVIAGQFSRGKEIREQEYYYETIAMLILIGKRLGQTPSRKY